MIVTAIVLGVIGLAPVAAFAKKQHLIDFGDIRSRHAQDDGLIRPDPNKNFDMNGKW